ncbi:hypothetical protein NP233_g11512 [Leucocoprinus birnbaumii]|uniref:Uncharacterized protein n=1 Tax=Leucocoprinus birnbaumii TaxID=56174 RepID=A0AAD5VGG1_9AGAR|nr:hypothetical protein NP233_g11512 [Leucocoprinus birnbaumii]
MRIIDAAELKPLSEFEYTQGNDPKFDYLSSQVPGLFLDLEIPENVSLLKVYGHRREGASSYGVCIDCKRNIGSFFTIDGHGVPSDSGPTCLFSLALEEQPPGHSLELHNAYDRQFSAHGTVAVSSVEYLTRDQGSLSAVDGHCDNHLTWPKQHHDTLFRRDNSSDTCGQTTQHGTLRRQMSLTIGLLATLIVIVVIIFLLGVYYFIRYRNKNRSLVLLQDPESKTSFDKRDLQLPSKIESQTLVPTTSVPSARDKDLLESSRLPPEGYSGGKRTTGVTIGATSSSFSTGEGTTKKPPNKPSSSEISPVISTMARFPNSQPPTSPPREPIPALPDDSPTRPSPTPIYQIYVNKGPSPASPHTDSPYASSPAQSRRPRVNHIITQPDTDALPQHSLDQGYGKTTLLPPVPRHLRNASTSDSSSASYDTRQPRRIRPPSKQLPSIPPPSPVFSPEPLPTSSPVRTRELTSRARTGDNGSNRNKPDRLTLTSTPLPMQMVREKSSQGSRPDPTSSPQRTRASPKPAYGTRSAENIRQQAQSRIPELRTSKSSPELEQPPPTQDVQRLRLGDVTLSSQKRHSIKPDRTSRADAIRTRRASRRTSRDKYQTPARVDVEFAAGLDFDENSAFVREVPRPPSAIGEDFRIQQARRARFQSHRPTGSEIGLSEDRTHETNEGLAGQNSRQPLPQPPPYEHTTQLSLPPRAVISPLSPVRRRALPKPPV